MSQALLLIAHGSRRDAANADLEELAELLRGRLEECIIETSFLEIAQPTIPQGLARCRDRGATEIRLIPYFLSSGTHVMTDLRDARDEFAAHHPGITVSLCPPLGVHPLIVDIILQRMNESL